MTRLRWALLALGLVAFLAALPGAGVRATYGAHTTADEPHYLITTISLLEDGNLDVADELADERWRDFHEVNLPIQEQVLDDGRQLAPHDPLLPLLLVPGLALGGWMGAKVLLALLAGALAALTAWTAVRRFGVRPAWAIGTVAVLSSSWPLSAYGTQVYPELPAALVAVAIVAIGTATGGPIWPRLVAVAALVTALPWLAIKYVPVATALTLVLAWRWWRDGHRREVLIAGVLLSASGLVYLALHQAWYGGWTVYAAADHFIERGEFAVIGFEVDPLGRSRRLIGLLVGRDFGLVTWQPLWLLAVPALAAFLRVRRQDWWVVAVPLAVGWLNATFVALTMQGWWVPGRQVVVVLPLAVIVLAWWLDRTTSGWRIGAGVLGAGGLVTSGWLVADGLAERLTWVVDFAQVGDPFVGLRQSVLPDYLAVDTMTWVLHGTWLAVLSLLGVLAWHGATSGEHNEERGAAGAPRSAPG